MSELRGRRGTDAPSEDNEPGDTSSHSGDTGGAENRSADRDSPEPPASREVGRTAVERKIADRELTAHEKLEQRLDEIYWPGYSKWSSTEQTEDASLDRRPTDPPSAPAKTPVDDRAEPEDPFASYSPELRAHFLHDDTMARLQYLSPPEDQTDSAAQDPTAPTDVESRDDEQSSEADSPDDPASSASPSDDDSVSPPTSDASDEPVADPARHDEPPAGSENAAATDHEPTADEPRPDDIASLDREDDAPGINPAPERVAAPQEAAEPDHEFVEDATSEEMDQYRRIREADDLNALAEHSGMPSEVIEEVKQHLFQRHHDVAVGPDDVRHGYFTPDALYGDLWERVASGAELTDQNRVEFWSLLAHEYVEAKLMEAGLPYRSSEPGAWDQQGRPRVTADHPSAHNTAPLSTRSTMMDLLILWDSKLGIPRGDLRVAEDLSNLDEVVRVAKEGLGL